MGWLRTHRRAWVWTALLALILQVGLSFGHVHGDVHGHAAVAATADPGGHRPPAAPDTGTPDDDYCAICAILTLLTGAQTASAPAVVPPTAPVTATLVSPPATILLEPVRIAFRSRAPPQA